MVFVCKYLPSLAGQLTKCNTGLLGFRVYYPPIMENQMENQMEKKMENAMETGGKIGILRYLI